MKSLALPVGLIVAAVSCGGAPAGGGGGSDAPSASSAEPAHAQTGSGSAGEDRAAALARHREEFMAACAKDLPNAPDFCQCSWDVFGTLFSEEEMASSPDPKKLAEFKRKLGPACGGKVPETLVREQFVEGCTRKGKDLSPYCTCAWTELRKTLSVADFAIQESAGGARVQSATRAMAKACSSKLPERVGREGFVTSCSAGHPEAGPFCECAWKQLRKSHSATEIFAGVADLEAMQPKIKAACGKLHPSQSGGR
jgi:hypothetical protein